MYDRRLMPRIWIRRASARDLPKLAPSLGSTHLFQDCLRRHRRRRGQPRDGVLLIATRSRRPVGRVYLRFADADEAAIRNTYPQIPLLQHLEVVESCRNQGIGTRLIKAAERALRRRGYRLVVLGVHPENKDAIRLYERLGYQQSAQLPEPIETTRREFLDTGDQQHPDECRVLVKELAAAAASPRRGTTPALGGGWVSPGRVPATVTQILGRLFS